MESNPSSYNYNSQFRSVSIEHHRLASCSQHLSDTFIGIRVGSFEELYDFSTVEFIEC